MTMTLPSVPDLDAGSIVTADDLNAIGAACTFLLDKPMALVYDSAGSQAASTTYPGTPVSFASKYYDTDGMWSSGSPRWLTIQTPGWYKVRYCVNTSGGTPASIGAGVVVSAGANNPAGFGTIFGPYWGSFEAPNSVGGARVSGGGLWPVYLYSADKIQLDLYASSATNTSNTNPSTLGVEWVST